MKMRILGMAMGLGALWAWAPGCSQPTPDCTVGSASASPYVVKYLLVSGDGACSTLAGEAVGLQTYNPANGEVPDQSRILVAMQAETMGYLLGAEVPDADDTHKAYSLGEFTSISPDSSDLCIAPTLSMGQQRLEFVEGEGGAGGNIPPLQEALDISYEWSNLKVFVTAASLGTQMEADLRYTQDGCSATYKAIGLWPAVSCDELELDDDGDAVPTGRPNIALCDTEPDPDAPYNIPYGSGIAEDLKVGCEMLDDGGHYCVLDATSIPAFK